MDAEEAEGSRHCLKLDLTDLLNELIQLIFSHVDFVSTLRLTTTALRFWDTGCVNITEFVTFFMGLWAGYRDYLPRRLRSLW